MKKKFRASDNKRYCVICLCIVIPANRRMPLSHLYRCISLLPHFFSGEKKFPMDAVYKYVCIHTYTDMDFMRNNYYWCTTSFVFRNNAYYNILLINYCVCLEKEKYFDVYQFHHAIYTMHTYIFSPGSKTLPAVLYIFIISASIIINFYSRVFDSFLIFVTVVSK